MWGFKSQGKGLWLPSHYFTYRNVYLWNCLKDLLICLKKKKQASTWKKQCSQAWITWDPRRTSPEHLYIEPKTRVLQDTFSYGGTYRHWFLGQATTWKEQCWFQQKGFIKTVGTIQMVFISERLLPKASGARKTWCRAPQSCDSGWSWVLYKNLTRLLVQKEQQLTICGRTIGSEQRKY